MVSVGREGKMETRGEMNYVSGGKVKGGGISCPLNMPWVSVPLGPKFDCTVYFNSFNNKTAFFSEIAPQYGGIILQDTPNGED